MASRILLADDSITIQKVVNLTFADEDIEVVAVNNGDLAERRLPEVNPDLVLADIFMPGKNGYELCEAIKANSQFRHVPVVLLVGAFEPFDQVEANRVGADAHLTKPFESRTLVETVRRLIGAGRPPAAPIPSMPALETRDEALRAFEPVTASFPLASPPPVNLEALGSSNNDLGSSSLPARATGELGSLEPDAPQDVLELSFADALPVEAVSGTVTDMRDEFERFEPLSTVDFSPAGRAMADAPDPHEMLQDFDRSEPFEPVGASSHNPMSLESEADPLLEVNISGAGEGEQWYSRDSYDTARLDLPSAGGGWRAPATGSPLTYQSPDFRLQTEEEFGASDESTEASCATLLAVDEPLGDVLFDERVRVDASPLLQTSSSDSLDLELREGVLAGAETAPTGSTQFELVDLEAEPAPQESFPIEENPPTAESVNVEKRSAPDQQLEFVATNPTPDSPVSHESDRGLDWTTPRAASYSTAQLESVGMPAEGPESQAQATGDQGAQLEKSSEETSSPTAGMWTEEEARFTPIDIEAVGVDEVPEPQMSAPETGFAFLSMPAEEPVASAEIPAASGANKPATLDLSAATLEDIIRRVVAEMSESIVREVAWDVVPDCVERVIQELTRESLSKRA